MDATEPLLAASFLPTLEGSGFSALQLLQLQEGLTEPAQPEPEHLRNDGSPSWTNSADTKKHSPT